MIADFGLSGGMREKSACAGGMGEWSSGVMGW